MDVSSKTFLDFADGLYATSNLDEMFALLETAILKLGFDGVSYTYVPRVIADSDIQVKPVFKVSREYNKKFIDHYTEANFSKDDFTIKRILSGNLSPIIWWQECDNGRLVKDEINVITVARADYRIQHGISFPTYTDGSGFAGVSVVSCENDKSFYILCSENTNLVRRMSFMFSDRVLSRPEFFSPFYTPFIEQLTSTEKLVLNGLISGTSIKKIAADAGRDYKYIANFVIPALRKRFGNINRNKLLVEIGANRLDLLLP